MPPVIDGRTVVGLRAPRSTGHNVWPQRGGLAVHWAGEKQGLGQHHVQCQARWKAWQTYHMDDKGWVDIAYNWGVCDHGHVLVGRGWGVRSAANGTDDGNDRYLAACWLGGPGDGPPSPLALDAFGWLVDDVRDRGAGRDVQPHSHFFNTACPGPVLVAHAALWARGSDAVAPPFPLPAGWYFGPVDGPVESVSGFHGHATDLARWQARVGGLEADGLYGDATAGAARVLQRRKGLDQDGLIGRLTWAAAWQGP